MTTYSVEIVLRGDDEPTATVAGRFDSDKPYVPFGFQPGAPRPRSSE